MRQLGRGPWTTFLGSLPQELRTISRLEGYFSGHCEVTMTHAGQAYAHLEWRCPATMLLYCRGARMNGLNVRLAKRKHPAELRKLHAAWAGLLALGSPYVAPPLPGRVCVESAEHAARRVAAQTPSSPPSPPSPSSAPSARTGPPGAPPATRAGPTVLPPAPPADWRQQLQQVLTRLLTRDQIVKIFFFRFLLIARGG